MSEVFFQVVLRTLPAHVWPVASGSTLSAVTQSLNGSTWVASSAAPEVIDGASFTVNGR
jgi:hypothetical protein